MTTKYAVLLTKSVYIPGDERSRTNPGHGYPEHTESFACIEHFKDYDDMLKWVDRREKSTYVKEPYTIIQFEELKVTTTVSVSVDKA